MDEFDFGLLMCSSTVKSGEHHYHRYLIFILPRALIYLHNMDASMSDVCPYATTQGWGEEGSEDWLSCQFEADTCKCNVCNKEVAELEEWLKENRSKKKPLSQAQKHTLSEGQDLSKMKGAARGW